MNLNKQIVTKENLLNTISDIDVYSYYAPDLDIDVGKAQKSPLRTENNPSFALFAKDNEVLFKDFVLGGGDCIRFVQLKFGYNFNDALSRIVIDFNLQEKFHHSKLDIKSSKKPFINNIDREELISKANNKTEIQIKKRNWNLKDMSFWKPFGIGLKTLKKYRVVPISYLFINEKIIACDDYTYAFIELKDGIDTYKIYQPFNPDFKWINNHDESVWQGWKQLPDKGVELIITKSLKDVMTLDAIAGIPAVSLQAESVLPKDHIIEELRNRFAVIWVWYDNDFNASTNWGREFGQRLANEYDLMQIEIPDEYQIKDPSDFCAEKGEKETKKLITELISVPF